MTCEQHYKKTLHDYCLEVSVESFNHPYELATRSDITLRRIFSDAIEVVSFFSPAFLTNSRRQNIDSLVSVIDQKINYLETLESLEKNVGKKPVAPGARLLLYASPGGGKTTLLKRLALAHLTKEQTLLDKYPFLKPAKANAFPLLLQYRSLGNITAEDLAGLDFPHIAYRLSIDLLGSRFSNAIPEADFRKMLISKAKSGSLFLLLDGWDEILNQQKEAAVLAALNAFLQEYPKVSILMTVRDEFEFRNNNQRFFLPFGADTKLYKISDLSSQGITEFCKNWYSVMFLDPQKQQGYKEFIRQIQLPYFTNYIHNMVQNPLQLCKLLAISHGNGSLPVSKAELYAKYADEFIAWHIRKSTTPLSGDCIRIFLAYVAWYMASNNILQIQPEQLIQVMQSCIRDLDGYFTRQVHADQAETYLEELLHTAVLQISANRKIEFSHRQLLEYFCAVAAVEGYRDTQSNTMTTAEVLQSQCKETSWAETIIFACSMSSHLALEIVRHLLDCVKNSSAADAETDLLYGLVSNNIRIPRSLKEDIFLQLFSDSITNYQIRRIIQLISVDTATAREFKTYIRQQFLDTVEQGDPRFGYVYGLVLSYAAHEQGDSPLAFAETLLLSTSLADKMSATQIFTILGWCVQTNIVIGPLYKSMLSYRMKPEAIVELRSMLDWEDTRFARDIAACIKDCILAQFADFEDFVPEPALWIQRLEQGDPQAKVLLSVAPVNLTYQENVTVSPETRSRYLQQLEDELRKKDGEDAIFTFGICAAAGYFENKQRMLEAFFQVEELPVEIESVEGRRLSMLHRTIGRRLCFVAGNNSYCAVFPRDNLSLEERRVLVYGEEENDGDILLGLFGDRLRRRMPAYVTCNGTEVGAEELLASGAAEGDPVCLLNMALLLSGTCVHEIGDMDKGLSYLKQQQATSLQVMSLLWLERALDKEEEGIVVLAWLHALNQIPLAIYSHAYYINELAAKVSKQSGNIAAKAFYEEIQKHVPDSFEQIQQLRKDVKKLT